MVVGWPSFLWFFFPVLCYASFVRSLPSSSELYCWGEDSWGLGGGGGGGNNSTKSVSKAQNQHYQNHQSRRGRTCRVKNLCYNTRKEEFYLLKGSSDNIEGTLIPSWLSKIPNIAELEESSDRRRLYTSSEPLLDLSAVDDHNFFFLRFASLPFSYFSDKKFDIRVLDRRTSNDSKKSFPLRVVSNANGGGKEIGDNSTDNTAKEEMLWIRGNSLVTHRFFPLNIMHLFHDDLLGLKYLEDIWPQLGSGNLSVYFFDHYKRQSYDELYSLLGSGVGKTKVEYLDNLILGGDESRDLRAEAVDSWVCWEDAVIGGSKEMAWYQYGYGRPQGPLPDGHASGHKLREMSLSLIRREEPHFDWWDDVTKNRWLRTLLKSSNDYLSKTSTLKELPAPPAPSLPSSPDYDGPCITIFSRKSNRLILNELELSGHLSEAFANLPVEMIRLEDHTPLELIKIIKRSVIAFGMHGSLLILAIFLQPGAVLVEGFPWGIPASQYTPYKEMCSLNGMQLSYKSWMNPSKKDTISYPNRKKSLGGIRHLPKEEQELIVNSPTIKPHPCCDNPAWLYKIFQDTKVDPLSIIELIREGLIESYKEAI